MSLPDHTLPKSFPQPAPTRRSLLQAASLPLMGLVTPSGATPPLRVVLNDASRLSPVPVLRHTTLEGRDEQAFIARVRAELKDCAANRRPFAVGGARHSMGGQSLPRDGHAITNALQVCDIDTTARTARLHSGSRWIQTLATLDRAGFSPTVMQSNADFSAGGTFSVNAHGWPAAYGPFGSTVRSVRLMLADGSIVNASRTENAELFGLAMGGYGLVGVLLDMEVELADNALLRPTTERMPAAELGRRFVGALDADKTIRMAYGRLSVARRGFLEEALLITYRPAPTPATGLPALSAGGLMSAVGREIFRAQIGSETGKQARWAAEARANPSLSAGLATRNTLMNEPVSGLAGRDKSRTDILHEYFVSPARFAEFLQACRDVILPSQQDLLNVTLRYVAADTTSVLSYASERRIAAVMLFSQRITPEDEADMLRMTEALIERVIAIGGSFYLPYRLHARRDQVERAYPRTPQFVERKRHYDPSLLLRNEMWSTYFA